MDKVKGSMEMLSSMQLTKDMAGMDAESKELLRNKAVLAVILKGVVAEYKGYSREEIMEFIEPDSVTDETEVSPGRTNTKVVGDSAEFSLLNEKVSYFDLAFQAKNPELSTENVRVSLHVDVEAQKTYHPGYPVEKRGIYYLARELSAQLSLVTENTDYGCLEKCYSIWICRDNVPRNERFSISFIEMDNTRNYGKCNPVKENYDMLTLVIIRLGDKVFHEMEDKEKNDMMEFLHAVMYPHGKHFLDTIKKHIDFSENEELWKEVRHMSGLGMSILEEGRVEGRAEEIIESGYDFGLSECDILARLQEKLQITAEQAERYMEMFEKQPV